MSRKRPVHLKLHQIRFPLTAIASIAHRLSGVFIFLLLPCLLWVFALSLTPAGFMTLQMIYEQHLIWQIIFFSLIMALIYHCLAGIRHLVMDLGIGETLLAAKASAGLVLGVSIGIAIKLGFMIWG